MCVYLLSKLFEFVNPGFYVGQGVTDLRGLLSHTQDCFFYAV